MGGLCGDLSQEGGMPRKVRLGIERRQPQGSVCSRSHLCKGPAVGTSSGPGITARDGQELGGGTGGRS